MKKSMMFVTVVFVAMMAFVGCANPVLPTDPDPVPVYLNDAMMFTNVADTSDTFTNSNTTGIYQMDGVGAYLLDGKAVTYDDSEADCFTITVNGKTFINNAMLGTWKRTDVATETVNIRVAGSEIVITYPGDPAVDYSFSDITGYTSGVIALLSRTWTR